MATIKRLITAILSCILLVLGQVHVYAQSEKRIPTTQISYLSFRDTLLLSVDNGRKYVYHTVKQRQTLFSLAKFYSISLEELFAVNPALSANPALRIGQQVKIPVPNIAIKRYKNRKFNSKEYAPICYVVQNGDNLFQIAKRYFDMPVDTIIRRNRLQGKEIKPGQLILMGWMHTGGVLPEWRPAREITTSEILRTSYDTEKSKHREVERQGVCFWQKESKQDGDLYVLHREALLGSVIAVTNPMSGRTVFAKCIGRIPEGYERNIECILSPAAARKIGARDPRFFVKIKYLY